MTVAETIEGLISTSLTSGNYTKFINDLKMLKVTPEEVRKMDLYGDSKFGELIAKVLDDVNKGVSYNNDVKALVEYTKASQKMFSNGDYTSPDNIKVDANVPQPTDLNGLKADVADLTSAVDTVANTLSGITKKMKQLEEVNHSEVDNLVKRIAQVSNKLAFSELTDEKRAELNGVLFSLNQKLAQFSTEDNIPNEEEVVDTGTGEVADEVNDLPVKDTSDEGQLVDVGEPNDTIEYSEGEENFGAADTLLKGAKAAGSWIRHNPGKTGAIAGAAINVARGQGVKGAIKGAVAGGVAGKVASGITGNSAAIKADNAYTKSVAKANKIQSAAVNKAGFKAAKVAGKEAIKNAKAQAKSIRKSYSFDEVATPIDKVVVDKTYWVPGSATEPAVKIKCTEEGFKLVDPNNVIAADETPVTVNASELFDIPVSFSEDGELFYPENFSETDDYDYAFFSNMSENCSEEDSNMENTEENTENVECCDTNYSAADVADAIITDATNGITPGTAMFSAGLTYYSEMYGTDFSEAYEASFSDVAEAYFADVEKEELKNEVAALKEEVKALKDAATAEPAKEEVKDDKPAEPAPAKEEVKEEKKDEPKEENHAEGDKSKAWYDGYNTAKTDPDTKESNKAERAAELAAKFGYVADTEEFKDFVAGFGEGTNKAVEDKSEAAKVTESEKAMFSETNFSENNDEGRFARLQKNLFNC